MKSLLPYKFVPLALCLALTISCGKSETAEQKPAAAPATAPKPAAAAPAAAPMLDQRNKAAAPPLVGVTYPAATETKSSMPLPSTPARPLMPAGVTPAMPAVAAPASPSASAGAPGSGVSGVAKFDGPRPKRSILKMDADPKCVALHGATRVGSEDEIVGAAGEIMNVFVYVKAGAASGAPVPALPATLTQNGCMYKPHVQGMIVGQKLEIVNTDPTMHNVHALAKANPEFNRGQPSPGTIDRTFNKAEMPIKFKCDVHPWMSAYIFVMENPYFGVTDANGSYSIPNLPPGKYTIAAWHEKYGEKTMEVTIASGVGVKADFTFKP